MNKHVKLLAAAYLVWGAMGLVALLIVLIFVLVGSGLAAAEDAHAGAILGSIGMVLVGITAVASLPNILAGYGLLQYRSWARILTIILSVVHLPAFPLGTALGAYGLWVLFQADVARRFEDQGRSAAPA